MKLTIKEKKAVAICAWMGPADWTVYSTKDGLFEARKSYFYTHGNTADGLAEKLQKHIPGMVIEDTGDMWRAWPKLSFWWVRFTCDLDACVEKAEGIAQQGDQTLAETYGDFRGAHDPIK